MYILTERWQKLAGIKLKEMKYPDTAEEYAILLNAEGPNSMSGLVTDKEHWAKNDIHTGAELAHYLASSSHWDLYKDVHGIRPRDFDYKAMSIDDIENEIIELQVTQQDSHEHQADEDAWREEEDTKFALKKEKEAEEKELGFDDEFDLMPKHSGMKSEEADPPDGLAAKMGATGQGTGGRSAAVSGGPLLASKNNLKEGKEDLISYLFESDNVTSLSDYKREKEHGEYHNELVVTSDGQMVSLPDDWKYVVINNADQRDALADGSLEKAKEYGARIFKVQPGEEEK